MIFEISFTLEAEETNSALSKQLEQRWGKQETTEIRKCIIHKDCSMFYRIYDTQIIIIFFWDNRQDPMFMT